MQAAFDAHIEAERAALWTRFANVQDVRLLREVESDRPDTRFDLAIEMRSSSQQLFDLFEGDVFHTVFRTDVLTVPPA